jgi:hypothetical protein
VSKQAREAEDAAPYLGEKLGADSRRRTAGDIKPKTNIRIQIRRDGHSQLIVTSRIRDRVRG